MCVFRFELAKLADLTSKGKKLVELSGSKQFVLLHLHNDNVYAMDAYSTAYQYPLLDAKVGAYVTFQVWAFLGMLYG